MQALYSLSNISEEFGTQRRLCFNFIISIVTFHGAYTIQAEVLIGKKIMEHVQTSAFLASSVYNSINNACNKISFNHTSDSIKRIRKTQSRRHAKSFIKMPLFLCFFKVSENGTLAELQTNLNEPCS